jgi:hypothetical protein
VALVEWLRAEARDPVDRVLEDAGHRGVVFGARDHERVARGDAIAELFRFGREALPSLDIGVVGARSERGHRGEIDFAAVGSDCLGGQLSQPCVQRAGAE